MELSLKDYFFIIIKRWKIIVSLVLAGMLIMFFWSFFIIKDKYEISTTASLYKIIQKIDPNQSEEINTTDKENTAFERIVSRFNAELTGANYLYDLVWNTEISQLSSSYDSLESQAQNTYVFKSDYSTIGEWAQKIGYTKKSLRQALNFSFSSVSKGYFTISITVTNPDFGVCLLAAYNLVSKERVSEISEQATYNTIVKSSYLIIDQPIIPEDKDVIRPNIPVNMLLGALVGAVLAVTIILIVNFYDVKIKNEDDIREKFDVPVIATIPDISEIKERNV
ncbi:MAG TPA: Wzz/FepE/Etk N-terminal domain-containing protein [Clostridia bacterium]